MFYSYRVHVTTDTVATVQLQTSRPDVLIRLSILDHEKQVAGKTGKGHVVIPVFFFLVNKGEVSLGAVTKACDDLCFII